MKVLLVDSGNWLPEAQTNDIGIRHIYFASNQSSKRNVISVTLNVKYIIYQTSVIFAGYCHHSAVLGSMLMTHPLYVNVSDFLKITEGLPFLKKKRETIKTIKHHFNV